MGLLGGEDEPLHRDHGIFLGADAHLVDAAERVLGVNLVPLGGAFEGLARGLFVLGDAPTIKQRDSDLRYGRHVGLIGGLLPLEHGLDVVLGYAEPALIEESQRVLAAGEA